MLLLRLTKFWTELYIRTDYESWKIPPNLYTCMYVVNFLTSVWLHNVVMKHQRIQYLDGLTYHV